MPVNPIHKEVLDNTPPEAVRWTVKPYSIFADLPDQKPTHRRGLAIMAYSKTYEKQMLIPVADTAVMEAPMMSCWESSPINQGSV